jgi:hypothetical protein
MPSGPMQVSYRERPRVSSSASFTLTRPGCAVRRHGLLTTCHTHAIHSFRYQPDAQETTMRSPSRSRSCCTRIPPNCPKSTSARCWSSFLVCVCMACCRRELFIFVPLTLSHMLQRLTRMAPPRARLAWPAPHVKAHLLHSAVAPGPASPSHRPRWP